jgi:hypothetical protein
VEGSSIRSPRTHCVADSATHTGKNLARGTPAMMQPWHVGCIETPYGHALAVLGEEFDA